MESDLVNRALRTSQNSSQGLNINSISVFDQIRDPEIPITIRPLFIVGDYHFYRLFMKAMIVI